MIREQLLPRVVENAREMQRIFAALEAVEAFVKQTGAVVHAADERLGKMEAAYRARHPMSVEKMIRSLSFLPKRAETTPAEMPKPLPAPDLKTDALLATLRDIGSSASPPPGGSGAAAAPAEPPAAPAAGATGP